MRLIDADNLIKLMEERDEDCGKPKNSVDMGYSLAVEHMKWEIEQNNDYHCKTFDLADHDKQIRNEVIEEYQKRLDKELYYFSGYPNCGEYDYAYEVAFYDARRKSNNIA